MNTILVIGGYGVFGGRLVQLLLREPDLRVIVAGRSAKSAGEFCARHGGEPLALDRDGGIEAALKSLAPTVVIDAAGPFQAYGENPYRLARAALATGAHYLDLADDADFAAGITALDEQARAADRVAISGASSVPAISSAAVEALAQGLTSIDLIESVILPGNRAPRGLSVVRAILAQAGQPLALWRGGRWTSLPGWSALKRVSVACGSDSLPPRWTSVIGAPDLKLFPQSYRARSVLFRAGLELPLLHLGLWLLAWLPRLRLVRSLEPCSVLLRRVADWFVNRGSDRGAMQVSVTGRDAGGGAVCRSWSLLVEAGDGPAIPAIASFLLARKLLRGDYRAGARPCLGELTLDETERGLKQLKLVTAQTQHAAPCLYERVLGGEWARLPAPLRDLHQVHDQRMYAGESQVENGKNLLATLLRRVMGFPPSAAVMPVQVTIEVTAEGERWTRQFGAHRFHSVMSLPRDAEPGVVMERFGLIKFRLGLPVTTQGLEMPMLGASCLGVRLPRWLTPRSQTREYVDHQGRFCFDVAISLPLTGLLVRYRGWLLPLTA